MSCNVANCSGGGECLIYSNVCIMVKVLEIGLWVVEFGDNIIIMSF